MVCCQLWLGRSSGCRRGELSLSEGVVSSISFVLFSARSRVGDREVVDAKACVTGGLLWPSNFHGGQNFAKHRVLGPAGGFEDAVGFPQCRGWVVDTSAHLEDADACDEVGIVRMRIQAFLDAGGHGWHRSTAVG